MAFRSILLNGKCLSTYTDDNINNIKTIVSQLTHLSPDEFYLTQNGKLLTGTNVSQPQDLHVHLRIVGGKGGFGSMLRAIGAQIEKTTNREACRDLSGRRLRDINEEKRVKAWLEKQKERDEEAAMKTTKKIEKLQAKPRHEFKDKEYDEARSVLTETVHDALEEGLKKAAEGSSSSSSNKEIVEVDEEGGTSAAATKRKAADDDKNAKKKKKKKNIKGAQWLDDELGSSSDSDSDSDSGASNSTASTSQSATSK